MKIAFFDLKREDKNIISANFPNDDLYLYEQIFSDEIIPEVAGVDVISLRDRSKISKQQADKLTNLKLIANRITGFDNIDPKIYSDGRVCLCNVPAYGSTTVAEYVFAHILNLSRKLSLCQVREDLKVAQENQITGFDLENKTLGIIGTGKIGQKVAKIGAGFSMRLIGYDICPEQKLQRDFGLKYVSLEELLANADVITLNLPLTDQTRYTINLENVKKVKRGSILINTGRGALIETKALILALDQGIIVAAGLDVLEGEDIIFKAQSREKNKVDEDNLKLLGYDNVTVTPHNAYNSAEAYRRSIDTTIQNIRAFQVNVPINTINIG